MGQVFGILCVLGGLLFGVLFTAVVIFQVACRWCRLERPSFFAAAGIVLISWVVWAVVEAVMIAILEELYRAAGQPPWEARIIGFFLGLPAQLAVTSLLHVGLMRVRLGKAIEVWFIQWLIVYSLVLAITGVVVVAILAARN